MWNLTVPGRCGRMREMESFRSVTVLFPNNKERLVASPRQPHKIEENVLNIRSPQ